MTKGIFDEGKARQVLLNYEWKITTKKETKQGVVVKFENSIVYFKNGERIKLSLHSEIEKVLKLTREEALSRVLVLNKTLENEIDKTDKLYKEREDLMKDYYIGFVDGKFNLKQGEEYERSKKQGEKVLWSNLLVFGAEHLRFGKSKSFSPFAGDFLF